METYYPDKVPQHLTYPQVPLQRLLEDAARRYPEATATVFFGQTMTYRELDEEANRFAHALICLGVIPGDRVAIHLPNSPQFLISFFGALKAGAIATAVSPLYEAREVSYQLADAGAQVMVTLSQENILAKALAAQEEAHLHHLVVTNIKDYFPPALRALFTAFREKKEGHRAELDPNRGQLWFKELIKKQDCALPELTHDPARTAVLQYTGGTTGLPRGAELTHANLVANAVQARAWFYDLADAGERMLLVAPLFHVYALTCCNMIMLLAGAAILLPRFDLPELLSTIDRERPTVFPGIPAMYAAINHSLLRATAKKKADLTSIRYCISGSDKLPADVKAEFERLSGGKLLEGYGLTEASPVTHVNPIDGHDRTGSIGLPVSDTETRIVDLFTGDDVAPGETGELLVRGPQVMRGYWHNPEETAAAISSDGWLSTGDIAYQDEEGFLYIVDRKKDIIITGGLNVYPREIEDVLSQYAKIKEVAVKGIPSHLRGEAIKAFVVLKDNEQATAEEIRRFASQKLADYKVPRQVEFLEELPRSILRKVLKRNL